MCIAIYSLKGNPIPKDEILKNCFINNDDGAGFAFNLNGHVEIRKGFMTYGDFIDAFHEYNELYNFATRGVLIHFRIATHGGTNKSCCHPFPLSDSNKHLKKETTSADYAVIHNGIIRLCTDKADKEKVVSDTMVFIRDYLTKIDANKKWFYNDRNFELIEKLADSKIAILNGKGEIKSTEGFHKGEDGNYYSNDSYMESYRLYNGFYNHNCYDEYDTAVEGLELMKLKRNETVLFDDGSTEEYDRSYHEEFPTFMSSTGNIYACYDGMSVSNVISPDRLCFIGTGIIVDERKIYSETYEPEFRSDVTVFDFDSDDLAWAMG